MNLENRAARDRDATGSPGGSEFLDEVVDRVLDGQRRASSVSSDCWYSTTFQARTCGLPSTIAS